jgi:predicted TIM-barrel fold metal-dependent hydrolase
MARAAAAAPSSDLSERMQATIGAMSVDDTHCHPIGDKDAHTTVDDFIERIALPAFPGPAYFPEGVYDRYKRGDAAARAQLDNRYNIGRTLNNINRHFESSVFVKYMVKELAQFLGCKPTFAEVIEARNAHAKDYFGYIKALFRDANIANVMIDTGYADGLDAKGIQRFEDAVAPTRAHYIARVETITDELFEQELPYNELRDRFVTRVRAALDGNGNFGKRSVGMKSYLLPDIGVIRPTYDDEAAGTSWEEFKRTRKVKYTDRIEFQQRGKVLRERLLTLAIEECLERDMPMQFHAGDGEAPSVILRNQQPYYLEDVARFDKDGLMRMPKIIPIHAGYPLVSEAAWLSHLYTNVYFELSLMTPFIHQGLLHRYLEIMEAVPLSKILFGSDAYHVPELYWLAARWGKRYLAQALAVYVQAGVLDEPEALQAARMILHLNNRQAYNLMVCGCSRAPAV